MSTQIEIKSEDDEPPAVVSKGKRLVEWVMDFRIVRAVQRYTTARGPQLSGGIAYSALFAIAGALTISLTVFSYLLGGNQELRDRLFESIDATLPGVLKMDGPHSEGIVEPSALIVDNPFNLYSLIGLLVLLWSSIGLMTGIRNSVLTMFGISRIPRNPAVAKLLDLSGFLVLGLAVLLTTVLAMAAQFFAEPMIEFFQFTEGTSSFLLSLGTFVIALVVDMCVIMFLIRVMAGARAPKRDLLIGGLVGGLGSGLLRYLGTSVVGSVSDNEILRGFAAIVTLLLWVNFLARLLLLSACVVANPPSPGKPTPSQVEHLEETPNYVTESDPETKRWVHDPISGTIAPDPPEHEPDPVPEWKGFKARRARKKVDRAKHNLEVAEQELAEAEQEYRDGAWEAFHATTTYTTNQELTQIEEGDVKLVRK
ncbi:membrane protein [Trueperella bonasi]|uniref:Membrane protein n=1 Tax=Trueperella bonasi TaxID=312286 RepID=A0ABT9NF22_9ACTO|nr:YihY/virulence factor BrkB family protein [Trueperella bonasi]MDP9805797.1 membrane protein [Trueperella bonasi]